MKAVTSALASGEIAPGRRRICRIAGESLGVVHVVQSASRHDLAQAEQRALRLVSTPPSIATLRAPGDGVVTNLQLNIGSSRPPANRR